MLTWPCRLMAAIAACALSPAALALDVRPNVPEGAIEVSLDVTVAEILDPETEFTFVDYYPLSDGTGRAAVSTIQGTVRMIGGAGDLIGAPLLTKEQSGLVLPQEAGMTGIALHPDFNSPGTFGYGKLYTITTERRESQGGVDFDEVDFPFANERHQDVVREWDLGALGGVPGNPANNSFTGALADSREVLRVAQPGPFHNVVDLAFNTSAQPGDDDYGLLYVTSGDGGNSSSQSNLDRAQSAQDLSTVFGNVLRIDPDPTAHDLVRNSALTGEPAYSVPDDNPYNGDDVVETRSSGTLAEIWANGFRSPWRATFDRATGDLYVGDVGENAWEEASRVVAGENYGWGLVEGTHDGTLIPGDGTPTPGLTPPIIELNHSDSRSITGGFVYRGDAIPELQGKYVFADLGQGFSTGALMYAIVDPDDPDGDVGDVFEFQLSEASPKFEDVHDLPVRIFSMAEDENGELYIVGGPDPRSGFVFTRPSVIVRIEPRVSLPMLGDLDDDGAITAGDWTLFKAGQGVDFSELSFEEARMMGDLNGDFAHDLADFFIFRTLFDEANGEGALAALATAPEPGGMACLLGALCGTSACTARRGRCACRRREGSGGVLAPFTPAHAQRPR